MTSPPYGDNRTTIPYGQYAYLPMQWIPAEDIASDADCSLIANTYAIDTASLGGSNKRAIEKGRDLCEKYAAARRFSGLLAGQSDRLKRFYAFFADLEECVDQICDVTAVGGYQAWTIGNRRLDGKAVPMGAICWRRLKFDPRGCGQKLGLVMRRCPGAADAGRGCENPVNS